MPDPAKHDFDAFTHSCRRCGATAKTVVNGDRADSCEPGVIGITHLAMANRMAGLLGPLVEVPLLRLSDLGRRPPRDDGPEVA